MKDGDLAHIKPCGCWVVYIAQGVMVLPCYGHETSVLTAINKPFGMPEVENEQPLDAPGC